MNVGHFRATAEEKKVRYEKLLPQFIAESAVPAPTKLFWPREEEQPHPPAHFLLSSSDLTSCLPASDQRGQPDGARQRSGSDRTGRRRRRRGRGGWV